MATWKPTKPVYTETSKRIQVTDGTRTGWVWVYRTKKGFRARGPITVRVVSTKGEGEVTVGRAEDVRLYE
jgi:hypothetical protein